MEMPVQDYPMETPTQARPMEMPFKRPNFARTRTSAIGHRRH